MNKKISFSIAIIIILICVILGAGLNWRQYLKLQEETKMSGTKIPEKSKIFWPKQEMLIVKVYFNNDKFDPEFSCNKVFPVEREIPKTQAVAQLALEELLNGPTEEELADGFFTNINPGVAIQNLVVENGIAKVDFDEQLEFQVGGSCRVAAIRAEITQTLKQFPTVDSVIISVNGRTEDILQP